MITVHHLAHSRSLRIVWLLEELGLDYAIERYERDPKTFLAPPELKAVHPLGRAPIVVDDGIALIESGAVIELLLEGHAPASPLRPAPGTPDHRRYLTFLHFAEGSLMPPLLLRLIFSRMEAGAPALLRPLVRAVCRPVSTAFVDPKNAGTLDFLEAELGARRWFAGEEFSAADIQMSYPVDVARTLKCLDARRPRLLAFLAAIESRPAHARALARIGE